MIRVLWFVVLALAWGSQAAAESRLFASETPLKIVITAPFPALVSAAKFHTDPFPATLTAAEGAAPAQTFAVRINARGLTRRTAGYCSFPPLALNFDKASVHGTMFHGQGKLKLVTYCRTPPDYEQRIILEYTAYRLYNLLTPLSFRVRAADVTYRNSPTDAGVTRFGFLIEDIDDVAGRNHRDKLTAKTRQVAIAQLDGRAAVRAALFEFMLGNLDWDQLAAPGNDDCCHNSRLIAAPGATPANASAVVPVPYDFDFSGFVDSPYAGPPPSIPIDRLTQRWYRGYCPNSVEVPAVVAEFQAHRAEMMALLNNEPRLNAAFRGKATKFLEGFFTLLDDPGRVQSQIVKHCR
jgi:hypothetical protein